MRVSRGAAERRQAQGVAGQDFPPSALESGSQAISGREARVGVRRC